MAQYEMYHGGVCCMRADMHVYACLHLCVCMAYATHLCDRTPHHSFNSNLDPFGRHGDDELWQVLRGVGLADTISALESKLGAPVVDGGNNFSQV